MVMMHLSPKLNKRTTIRTGMIRLNNSKRLARMQDELVAMEGQSRAGYEQLMREVTTALMKKNRALKGK